MANVKNNNDDSDIGDNGSNNKSESENGNNDDNDVHQSNSENESRARTRTSELSEQWHKSEQSNCYNAAMSMIQRARQQQNRGWEHKLGMRMGQRILSGMRARAGHYIADCAGLITC